MSNPFVVFMSKLFVVFVGRPELAVFIALLFFAPTLAIGRRLLTRALAVIPLLVARAAGTLSEWVSRRFRAWPFGIASLAWALYAGWEWHARANHWDIRVDLLVIYPGLQIVSVLAIILSCRRRPTLKAS